MIIRFIEPNTLKLKQLEVSEIANIGNNEFLLKTFDDRKLRCGLNEILVIFDS